MKAKYIALIFVIAVFACKPKKQKEDLQVEVTPQDTAQLITPEPVVETITEAIDEGVNLDDKYFLVINSYTVQEIGEKWNQVYRDRGFKSDLVMKRSDGFYRLALKSFDDVDLAKEALAEMKKDEEFNELWIMVK